MSIAEAGCCRSGLGCRAIPRRRDRGRAGARGDTDHPVKPAAATPRCPSVTPHSPNRPRRPRHRPHRRSPPRSSPLTPNTRPAPATRRPPAPTRHLRHQRRPGGRAVRPRSGARAVRRLVAGSGLPGEGQDRDEGVLHSRARPTTRAPARTSGSAPRTTPAPPGSPSELPAGTADRRLGRWVLATARSLGERSDQLVVRMGCTISLTLGSGCRFPGRSQLVAALGAAHFTGT